MNKSLTPFHSLAIDPDCVPLGAPFWADKFGKDPMKHPMIAQDTGLAIKGS